MKRLLWLLLFLAPGVSALTYDSGGQGVSGTTSETINNLTVNGNTILGDASSDSVTQNAGTVSFPNDTVTTLGGGANGWIIRGDVVVASNTIVDAYTASFGAVTAASTATVTWTELTDRLGEFVTSSFTVTLAGFYEISVGGGASQTAGTGCLLIKNNGTTIAGATNCTTGATALATVLSVNLVRTVNLAAGDIVRIDGSATTANVTFTNMNLSIRRVP